MAMTKLHLPTLTYLYTTNNLSSLDVQIQQYIFTSPIFLTHVCSLLCSAFHTSIYSAYICIHFTKNLICSLPQNVMTKVKIFTQAVAVATFTLQWKHLSQRF